MWPHNITHLFLIWWPNYLFATFSRTRCAHPKAVFHILSVFLIPWIVLIVLQSLDYSWTSISHSDSHPYTPLPLCLTVVFLQHSLGWTFLFFCALPLWLLLDKPKGFTCHNVLSCWKVRTFFFVWSHYPFAGHQQSNARAILCNRFEVSHCWLSTTNDLPDMQMGITNNWVIVFTGMVIADVGWVILLTSMVIANIGWVILIPRLVTANMVEPLLSPARSLQS